MAYKAPDWFRTKVLELRAQGFSSSHAHEVVAKLLGFNTYIGFLTALRNGEIYKDVEKYKNKLYPNRN